MMSTYSYNYSWCVADTGGNLSLCCKNMAGKKYTYFFSPDHYFSNFRHFRAEEALYGTQQYF